MEDKLSLVDENSSNNSIIALQDWKTNIYHPRHPIGHLLHEHNHSLLVEALNRINFDISKIMILDIGSGYGYWLRYLVELGATPDKCYGVDLSEDRIRIAILKNSAIHWLCKNCASLPFQDNSFDFVMQIVVFSSIQDTKIRIDCANEMIRVLKMGGILFWIDLIYTKSDQLVRFSMDDIRKYFPRMEIIYQKRVHPWYFRRLNDKFAWIARSIYELTKYGCESKLVMMRKPFDERSKY